MEIFTHRSRNATAAAALSAALLTACSFSVDSYLTDASNVQCDGRRTEVDLSDDGMATFIVHGLHKRIATVKVRRSQGNASVAVSGDVAGSPPQLSAQADGFTTPVPVVNGAELSAYAAGGSWAIDVSQANVVIQGSCDGQ
jgi:hypothetical protein